MQALQLARRYKNSPTLRKHYNDLIKATVSKNVPAATQANRLIEKELEKKDWMISGQRMTFKEFADTLFPEDTAERTMFFLKYSK